MNRATVRDDDRGTEDGREAGVGVIMQRVRVEGELGILQSDTVVEDGELRGRGILAIEGGELVEGIDDEAALEVVSDVGIRS